MCLLPNFPFSCFYFILYFLPNKTWSSPSLHLIKKVNLLFQVPNSEPNQQQIQFTNQSNGNPDLARVYKLKLKRSNNGG